MLVEGLVLGGITLAGLGITYKRLPARVQTFVCRHPLITDAVCVVFFYKLMGMTLVAHVAVAAMTLGMQALMSMERNKAEYQYLYDLMSAAGNKFHGVVESIKSSIKAWSEQNNKKIEVTPVE